MTIGKMKRSKRRYLYLRRRDTAETALGVAASDGCVLVQFDRIDHPQSHGWHLYPRHHFLRRRFPHSPRLSTPPRLNDPA